MEKAEALGTSCSVSEQPGRQLEPCSSSSRRLMETAAGPSLQAPFGCSVSVCPRQTASEAAVWLVGSTECGWEGVWVRCGCVQGTLLSCHLQTNHRMGRRREGVEVAPGGLEREERRLD